MAKEIIESWFKNEGLLYGIDPVDEKEIEAWSVILAEKLPELYKILRELDKVPENSYNRFVALVERSVIQARNTALFGDFNG